jgi:hypothetical protein
MVIGLYRQSLRSLVKRDGLVGAHQLKGGNDVFLDVFAQVGGHGGEALE